MDSVLRDIKRRLSQSPDDPELITKWLRIEARMGNTKIRTYYRVRKKKSKPKKNSKEDDYLYLSSANRQFTSQGTQFKSRDEALRCLSKVYSHHINNAAVEIVTCRVYTSEESAEIIDVANEKKRLELKKIRDQKRALENREKKLLQGLE